MLTCFCSDPLNDEGLKDNNSGRENRNQGHDFDDANGGHMVLTILAWVVTVLSQTLSVESWTRYLSLGFLICRL